LPLLSLYLQQMVGQLLEQLEPENYAEMLEDALPVTL
jgi:hypothetical protein